MQRLRNNANNPAASSESEAQEFQAYYSLWAGEQADHFRAANKRATSPSLTADRDVEFTQVSQGHRTLSINQG